MELLRFPLNLQNLYVLCCKVASQLAELYLKLKPLPCAITLREIIKIVRRHELFRRNGTAASWWDVTLSFLMARMDGAPPATREKVVSTIKLIEGWVNVESPFNWEVSIAHSDKGVRFREGPLSLVIPDARLSDCAVWSSERPPPKRLQRKLVQLVFALAAGEPVLLIGPTSFKTVMVNMWMDLTNCRDKSIITHITGDTEASDLLGNVRPMSWVGLMEYVLRLGIDMHERLGILKGKTGYKPDRKEKKRDDDLKSLLVELPHQIGDFVKMAISHESLKSGNPVDSGLSSCDLEGISDIVGKYDMSWGANLDDYAGKPTGQPSLDLLSDDSHSSSSHLRECLSSGDWSLSNQQARGSWKESEALESERSDWSEHSSEVDEVFIDDQPPCWTPEIAEFDVKQQKDQMDEASRNTTVLVDHALAIDTANCSDTWIENSGCEVSQSLADPALANCSSSRPDVGIPAHLRQTIDTIIHLMGKEVTLIDDTALTSMLQRFKCLWDTLLSGGGRDEPVFVFKDGPVSRAVKLGYKLILEDYDLCPQSVTERFNSILETEPTFTLPEDVTLGSNGSIEYIAGLGDSNIPVVTDKFRIIATVHTDRSKRTVNLSPATKSRFTQIDLNAYDNDDVRGIVDARLIQSLQAYDYEDTSIHVDEVATAISSLRVLMQSEPRVSFENDTRHIFRWVDFICNHTNEISLLDRVILGGKFFYLDELAVSLQSKMASNWWSELRPGQDMPALLRNLVADPMDAEPNDELPFRVSGRGNIEIVGLGLMATPVDSELLSRENISQRFRCTATPTTVLNVARIFAVLAAGSALLLEGPPGIGKILLIVFQQIAL